MISDEEFRKLMGVTASKPQQATSSTPKRNRSSYEPSPFDSDDNFLTALLEEDSYPTQPTEIMIAEESPSKKTKIINDQSQPNHSMLLTPHVQNNFPTQELFDSPPRTIPRRSTTTPPDVMVIDEVASPKSPFTPPTSPIDDTTTGPSTPRTARKKRTPTKNKRTPSKKQTKPQKNDEADASTKSSSKKKPSPRKKKMTPEEEERWDEEAEEEIQRMKKMFEEVDKVELKTSSPLADEEIHFADLVRR